MSLGESERLDCYGVTVSAKEQRISELYKEFGPVVYRRCLRILSHKEDAADVTAEVFIKLLKNQSRFADKEQAIPWIFEVATNHCLNHLRNQKRHLAHDAKDVKFESDMVTKNALDEIGDQQAASAVLNITDDVSKKIVQGVVMGEQSHEEVAAQLGVSQKTVQRKLNKFLEKAKAFLDRSEPK
jgi:RNA polymerase sigma-70 factor, ECF subfamily